MFNAIDAISRDAVRILGHPDHSKNQKICTEDEHYSLQELCRINNQLLIGLGVGHPKIDQICTTLARYGIHPKMTGAGGGGSLFAFLKPTDTSQTVIDMITSEVQKMGYDLWQPKLGGNGVVSHTTVPEEVRLQLKYQQYLAKGRQESHPNTSEDISKAVMLRYGSRRCIHCRDNGIGSRLLAHFSHCVITTL
ncbi:GHMP kinase protein [Trichuris suis]|nr:GHMP kinase protein [Trichuris suis]